MISLLLRRIFAFASFCSLKILSNYWGIEELCRSRPRRITPCENPIIVLFFIPNNSYFKNKPKHSYLELACENRRTHSSPLGTFRQEGETSLAARSKERRLFSQAMFKETSSGYECDVRWHRSCEWVKSIRLGQFEIISLSALTHGKGNCTRS